MACQQLLIFAALLFILKNCTCQQVAGASSSAVSTSSSTTSQIPIHSNSHFGLPALITPIANDQPIHSYNNLGTSNLGHNNFGSNLGNSHYGSGYYGNGHYGNSYGFGKHYPSQSPIFVDTDDDDNNLSSLIYLLLLLRNSGNGVGWNNGGNCGCGGGYGNSCGFCGGQNCGCGSYNGCNGNCGGSYCNNCGCSRNNYGYDSGNNYNGGYSCGSGPVVEPTPYVEDTVICPGNTYSYSEPREINLVIKTESCNKSS